MNQAGRSTYHIVSFQALTSAWAFSVEEFEGVEGALGKTDGCGSCGGCGIAAPRTARRVPVKTIHEVIVIAKL